MSDSKRVWIRVIQTVGVSLIAYLFPYFEKIISLDILFDFLDLIVTLIILGGLVMTAISLIIPPLLHYSCYKKTLSWFSIFMHFFVGIFSTVFMGISTFYSVKALIEQMYYYFFITNNQINPLLNTLHLLIYYL